MVKFIGDLEPELPNVEARTQFLHDLGSVVAMWSEFEVAIEFVIGRRTGLAPADSSLIFGTMGFEAKLKIVIALLARDQRDDAIAAVKDLVAFVRRNVLLHAALGAEKDFSRFAFWQRRLDKDGTIAKHEFTAETFHQRLKDMFGKISLAFDLLEINPDDLNAYARTAGFPDID